MQNRFDGGLGDIFGGSGFGAGPAVPKPPRQVPYLDPVQLTELWENNWLMAKICWASPKEMTRKWIKVAGNSLKGEDITAFYQYCNRKLKSAAAFQRAQTWANLYGGAVVYISINDGQSPDHPVEVNKIKSIDSLRVMDRYELFPDFTGIIDYEAPTHYTTTGEQSLLIGLNGQPFYSVGFRIHESRILRFDGVDIPYRSRAANMGWGRSKLQRTYQDFLNFVGTLDNGSRMIAEFDVFNHAIKGLSAMVAGGKTAAIKAHMQSVYMFLRQYGVLLTDGDVETAGFTNRKIEGFPQWAQQLQEVLTGGSNMPFSILWGRVGRAGIGGSGAHSLEQSVWAQTCSDQQEDDFRDPIERLAYYIFCAEDGPTKGTPPDDVNISFVQLLDPNPAEEVDNKHRQMLIDQGYHDMQVLTAKEIRDSRFAQADFSFDTQIDQGQPKADAVGVTVKGAPLMPDDLNKLADATQEDFEKSIQQWGDLPEKVLKQKFKNLLNPSEV